MVGGTPKFLFFLQAEKKIQCLYVWTDRWRSWAQTAKKQICLLGKLKVASLFPTGDTNSLWFCDRKYKTLPVVTFLGRRYYTTTDASNRRSKHCIKFTTFEAFLGF